MAAHTFVGADTSLRFRKHALERQASNIRTNVSVLLSACWRWLCQCGQSMMACCAAASPIPVIRFPGLSPLHVRMALDESVLISSGRCVVKRSTSLSLCFSVSLIFCLSLCFSVSLFSCLSVYLSLCVSVCTYVHTYVHS